MSCCAPAILSLRAECSKNLLCGVALLRLRAVCLRSRSRFGLAALATDITRTDSYAKRGVRKSRERRIFRKTISRITKSGERSIPPVREGGRIRRKGRRIGSVIR